jgi:hypothetical protein
MPGVAEAADEPRDIAPFLVKTIPTSNPCLWWEPFNPFPLDSGSVRAVRSAGGGFSFVFTDDHAFRGRSAGSDLYIANCMRQTGSAE